jgi:hypothetical protein
MNELINKSYNSTDCIALLNIIKKEWNINDYSSNLEGNCMYNHFTYNERVDNYNERYNLCQIGNISKKGVEIGFNAGHSAMLFFMGNPKLSLKCYDNCYHKYTIPCYKYLLSKYDIDLTSGDSRDTTFKLNEDKVDFIHIDGGNSKELAFKDIINCRQLIHKNTLLIIDDIKYTQIEEVVNFLISCNVLQRINYEDYGLREPENHIILKYVN